MILKAVSEHCSDNNWNDLNNNRLKGTINHENCSDHKKWGGCKKLQAKSWKLGDWGLKATAVFIQKQINFKTQRWVTFLHFL